LLAAFSSEGKRFITSATSGKREASWFSIIQAAFENLIKKRLTLEMTWGETE